MQFANVSGVLCEKTTLKSVYLARTVKVDFYLPRKLDDTSALNLLLINDGQDLVKMDFESILDKLYSAEALIEPLLCVGIHCSADRRMEYGIAGEPDSLGRGAKAWWLNGVGYCLETSC